MTYPSNEYEKRYVQEVLREWKIIKAIVNRHVLTEDENYSLDMVAQFVELWGEKDK